MKTRCAALLLLLLAAGIPLSGAQHFRSGMFLHHSTGGCIWGPNGGTVTVANLVTAYNHSHGFSPQDTFALQETWWPSAADNEWSTWHDIFLNRSTTDDIRPYMAGYPIVMIKSCFPSSSISTSGSASDTLSPTLKSVFNYKWHWRSIIGVMRSHPANFFVIWTNAPLVGSATTDGEAQLSDRFCRWAKDTLAAGGDPLVGQFPKNVFVFDFFHKLAGADGRLPLGYASSSSDSHPNAAATALVAPQLVTEILDAAGMYETVSGVDGGRAGLPGSLALYQNYPNPFNPSTTISYDLPSKTHVHLTVHNALGQEIAMLTDGEIEAGHHVVSFARDGLASGVYFYRLRAAGNTVTKRLLIVR